MRFKVCVSSLALALLLGSPAFGKQPTASAPSAPPAADTTTLDDPMLDPVPSPKHVLSSWNEALTRLRSRDVELRTALVEVERARGDRRQALAGALPTIEGVGSVDVEILRADVTETDPGTGIASTTTQPPSPVATAAISLTQPLIAARAWYAIGTADKAIDVAKLNVDDAQRRMVSGVADAIVAVVSAEHVAEIDRAELRAALRRLNLTRRGAELGAGATIDVVRFDQDVSAARDALLDGDEALFQARDRLGLALGSSEPFGVAPNIKLDDIAASANGTCKAGPLRDRPDLRALVAQKELSERRVTEVDLEYVPTAELSSTLAVSSEPLVGDGHASFNVMGTVTVPIWDGGARYGERRSASADVSDAELQIESAERQATIELSQVDRAVRSTSRSLENAERSLVLAKKTKELVDRAFEAGTGTSFDIVDASSKVRETELAVADKQLAVTRAKIAALLSRANCKY